MPEATNPKLAALDALHAAVHTLTAKTTLLDRLRTARGTGLSATDLVGHAERWRTTNEHTKVSEVVQDNAELLLGHLHAEDPTGDQAQMVDLLLSTMAEYLRRLAGHEADCQDRRGESGTCDCVNNALHWAFQHVLEQRAALTPGYQVPVFDPEWTFYQRLLWTGR